MVSYCLLFILDLTDLKENLINVDNLRAGPTLQQLIDVCSKGLFNVDLTLARSF